MDTFKITNIADNGEVTVKFSFSLEPVVIGGLPLNDKEALVKAISSYGEQLKKQLASREVDSEVTKIINKSQDIVKEEELTPEQP